MIETFFLVVIVVWVARALSGRVAVRQKRLSAAFDNARSHTVGLGSARSRS